MSNDPLAIIFVSNGPGELATWVKPLAQKLHQKMQLYSVMDMVEMEMIYLY